MGSTGVLVPCRTASGDFMPRSRMPVDTSVLGTTGKIWISSGSPSLQVLCHRAPQLPLDPVLEKRESRGHSRKGSYHIPLPFNPLHPELLRVCLSPGPVFIFCLAFSFRLCRKYLTQKHGLLSKMRAAARDDCPLEQVT